MNLEFVASESSSTLRCSVTTSPSLWRTLLRSDAMKQASLRDYRRLLSPPRCDAYCFRSEVVERDMNLKSWHPSRSPRSTKYCILHSPYCFWPTTLRYSIPPLAVAYIAEERSRARWSKKTRQLACGCKLSRSAVMIQVCRPNISTRENKGI
ncbi:hypothetical protein BDQ17DRAFT_507719 [Cyathus striatus]|nr:hypothetical protein BDQ17DRAFT_507719 [Cyathus striatus]